MKKVLLILVVALFALDVSAQSYYSTSYCPDVAAFLDETGDYITEDIYNIDKSKINLKVVILTDFNTGNKIGYVDYTSQDATGNVMKSISAGLGTYAGQSTYYTSSLDYAEITKCIDILEYAKENLLKTHKDADKTRFYYTSRLGGRIGVKCENNFWYAFVNADPYGDTSFERAVQLGGNGIDKIIDAFKTAKSLIEEKTR